jgi:outer membrane protein TolC
VRYEAAAALLDVDAAESAVRVAAGALDLSRLELEQAQDRFRAGVSSTIELVQAQEAVARATEAHIARVYEHAVARGRLARVRGDVEHSFVAAAGGQQQ